MMRRRFLHLSALLAVLSVFACDRVTPVAPVGSTITISVNPSRIDAQGEAALVTIIVRKEDGTPVNPGTQVNVSTTLGTLEPEVTFTDETGVATSDLTGDGRIGMATVSATTGAAALVSVEVQIGSVAASITLTVTPSEIPKDPQGEAVLDLLALVRDDTGAPLGGSVVNFRSGVGTLDSRGGGVTTDDNGQAVDILRVTRGNLSVLLEPFFTVTAQTASEGGGLIEDLVDVLISGVPATITLQATPSAIADVGGETTLSAIVRDGLGDGLAGASVNFLTDLGTLASGGSILATDAQGQVRDTLALTEGDIGTLGSATTFNVRVETAGLAGAILEDTFQIRIASCRPIATFSCEQNSGDPNEYRFDWTQPDPTGLELKWTGTNNTTGSTVFTAMDIPTVTHRFSATGAHTVELQVTDPNCGDPPVPSASSIQVTVPDAC